MKYGGSVLQQSEHSDVDKGRKSHSHHIFSDTKRLWTWKSISRVCVWVFFFHGLKPSMTLSLLCCLLWELNGCSLTICLPISSKCCQLSAVIILRLMTYFPVWSKVKADRPFRLFQWIREHLDGDEKDCEVQDVYLKQATEWIYST